MREHGLDPGMPHEVMAESGRFTVAPNRTDAPARAAKLAAWNNYICPVQGAQQAMEQVDASLVDNPLIFPDAETLAQTFYFMPLDLETSTEYERDWADVQGG